MNMIKLEKYGMEGQLNKVTNDGHLEICVCAHAWVNSHPLIIMTTIFSLTFK